MRVNERARLHQLASTHAYNIVSRSKDPLLIVYTSSLLSSVVAKAPQFGGQ